jgi:hypothetical protein
MKTVYFFRQTGCNLVRIGTTSNLIAAFQVFDENNPAWCGIVGAIKGRDAEHILLDIQEKHLKAAYNPKPGFYAITDTEVEAICEQYFSTTPDWLPTLKQVITNNAGQRLSNIQIQELLEREGVKVNHVELGRALTGLGLKKRQARINGKVKLAYQL